MNTGYIYLIQSPYGYKIGKSKTPKTRANFFSIKLPFKIKLVKTVETTHYHKVEKDLHQHFQDKHLNGEWFDLADEEIAKSPFLCAFKGVKDRDLGSKG